MIENPFETKSDSFYFVNGSLIMHNKASYKVGKSHSVKILRIKKNFLNFLRKKLYFLQNWTILFTLIRCTIKSIGYIIDKIIKIKVKGSR